MDSKKLKGVQCTAELRSIAERVLKLTASAGSSDDVSATRSTLEKTMSQESPPSSSSSSSSSSSPSLPLSAIKAMCTIIQSSDESSDTKSTLLSQLNTALSNATLQFCTPQPKDGGDDAQSKKYRKRMDRLRLKAEEAKYSRLVNNLDTTVADDETMKSMTYATSVGMNMIVAPISFGAFMFFFSGQLFGWIVDKDDPANAGHGSNVDIRAVIAGVVSGVCMLFIEMTLFVIRSHEMDAAVTKKARRSTPNPFGYDKKKAERTFEG